MRKGIYTKIYNIPEIIKTLSREQLFYISQRDYLNANVSLDTYMQLIDYPGWPIC